MLYLPLKAFPNILTLWQFRKALQCLQTYFARKTCLLFYSLFKKILILLQLSSVAQSCLTLCDPMNRSTPGLPVHHQLPEFTQTHVHRVSDAIQPSYPLLSPSPPAPNPSQHQSLLQWVNSSHEYFLAFHKIKSEEHHFEKCWISKSLTFLPFESFIYFISFLYSKVTSGLYLLLCT